MEYFKVIPEEITLEILSRVIPTESVLDCKSVCKAWRNIICYHPSFSNMHLHHLNHHYDSGKLSFTVLTQNNSLYYFEYNHKNRDPVERIIRKINTTTPLSLKLNTRRRIIGSVNGLICSGDFIVFDSYFVGGKKPIATHLQDKIYVCNPITKEYIMLPQIKTDCDTHVYWSSGFGYVSSTNEYKVVRIMVAVQFVQVHIYTLGSGNGWRNLGNFDLEGSNVNLADGVLLNGVLYWLYFDLHQINDKIVTFDLAEEKFCEHISVPSLPSCYYNYKLAGVFNGFLFLAASQVIQGAICDDIWLLKKQNEHQSWVWSEEFRVDCSELFAATKTDDVLTYSNNCIYIVDPKASTSKMLVDLKEEIHQVLPHKNTLVSLKELEEEDTKIMERIETIINL